MSLLIQAACTSCVQAKTASIATNIAIRAACTSCVQGKTANSTPLVSSVVAIKSACTSCVQAKTSNTSLTLSSVLMIKASSTSCVQGKTANIGTVTPASVLRIRASATTCVQGKTANLLNPLPNDAPQKACVYDDSPCCNEGYFTINGKPFPIHTLSEKIQVTTEIIERVNEYANDGELEYAYKAPPNYRLNVRFAWEMLDFESAKQLRIELLTGYFTLVFDNAQSIVFKVDTKTSLRSLSNQAGTGYEAEVVGVSKTWYTGSQVLLLDNVSVKCCI